MSNPFLICTERDLRGLPRQWLLAERWEKAGGVLYDLDFMEAVIQRLGIDELMQEYRLALRLLSKEEIWHEKLAVVNRVLDRQAHLLRGKDAREQSAYLLQQLRNEFFESDLTKLQQRSEVILAGRRLPYIRLKFRWKREPPELVRTLAGHSDAINDVVLSADGRLAVSASDDQTLILWDVETGREIRSMREQSDWPVGGIVGVALSADGRIGASWSRAELGPQSFLLWDMQTGRQLHTMQGHADHIGGVALSADGRLAVSASHDRTLKVWDVKTGKETVTLVGHGYPVNKVALSADGRRAVSASNDHTLKVWDIPHGRELLTFARHDTHVQHVAMSADGRVAVSASQKMLRVWDVRTGQETLAFQAQVRHGEHSLAVSADGSLGVFAWSDGTLRVWDMAGGCERCVLKPFGSSARAVTVSADGRVAVSASPGDTLKVWDLSRVISPRGRNGPNAGISYPHRQVTPSGHTSTVSSIALSWDGQLAVSGSFDKTLKVWDTATGQEVRTLTGHTDAVESIVMSADGRLAISTSRDRTLKVWDITTGHELRTLKGHKDRGNRLALSANGRIAALWPHSNEDAFSVWDVEAGRMLRTIQVHSQWVGWELVVGGVALNADGTRAVSVSHDNTVQVWDLETGRELHLYHRLGDKVQSVTMSADERSAIFLSRDKTFQLWDLANGRELRTFERHTADITGVAFSADGQLVVSVSSDQTLRVWAAATGQAVITVSSDVFLTCCAIARDGRSLVMGDGAGAVSFWELVGLERGQIEGTPGIARRVR